MDGFVSFNNIADFRQDNKAIDNKWLSVNYIYMKYWTSRYIWAGAI